VHCKLLSKNNEIVAFESDGQQSLEFLTTKNDCSSLCLASTNKKRPNNLVVGQTFDHQILDMVELGVLRYKSIADYGGTVPKKKIGSKPMIQKPPVCPSVR
jgi:ribosome production factor 2